MFKNEGIWFVQLTDEYLRTLGSLEIGDGESPTVINTFLEDDYGSVTNAGDSIRGLERILRENPVTENQDGTLTVERNTFYTAGVCEVKIGERVFETAKVVIE